MTLMMPTIHIFDHATNFITYAPGQTIFQKGDSAIEMYAVLSGDVEIWSDDKIIEVVGRGGIFGEVALIDNSPRTMAAIARTEVKLVPVNQGQFTFLIQQTPYFALHVMQVLAFRLREQYNRLTY